MAFPPCHSFMFQTHEDPDLHLSAASSSLNNLPSCPPQHFHGGGGGIPFMMRRSLSFSGVDDKCNHHHYDHQDLHGGGDQDDLSDDGSQLIGEKKKRLNLEQVKTLEKSFEMGNKLEPERKLQLAKALGLQPRQVAIWFQNRRARWKTKQLEKDYDLLKRQFDAIKADNESLQAHNQKLQAEILALKNREPAESINLNIKETEGSCSNRSENNSAEIKLDISRTPPAIDSPLSSHQNPIISSRSLFPTSTATTIRPSGLQQLFHQNPSSRPELLQCSQKIDHMVKEESLSNMFCGIDDQSGFWPWLEQHQFN